MKAFFIGLFGTFVSQQVELCGSLIFNFQVCVLWDFPGVNNFKSAAVDKKWLHLQQTNYLYTHILGEDMEKCNAVINCLKPISLSLLVMHLLHWTKLCEHISVGPTVWPQQAGTLGAPMF